MCSTAKNLQKLQNKRYEIFKDQDVKTGHFDVTFEIEEKKLHAHKFILTSVSETMASWLSSRWMKNDEPVIIETYSYEDFYELLRFLYIGDCVMTEENVFQLIDMAEFFAVPLFKELCANFLLQIDINSENVEEIYEIADKYSLADVIDSVKDLVRYGDGEMFNAEKFCAFKKSFVEFLSTIDRDSDYKNYGDVDDDDYDRPTEKTESEFFEIIYKWAEHQVIKQKPIDDENFDLQEAVKNELVSILPDIKFGHMNLEFLMDFVLQKKFILSPDEVGEVYAEYRNSENFENEEISFESIYELAEKQAFQKQIIAAENHETFNIDDSIKADLAKVIKNVKFYRMNKQFLMNFVVGNGFITEEEANHVDDIRVEIKNNDKTITGVFEDNISLRKSVKKGSCSSICHSIKVARFAHLKFPIPTTPSTVKKIVGVHWYLCLGRTGVLAFKHHSLIKRNDYLLATMKGESEFHLSPNESTHLTISYKNV